MMYSDSGWLKLLFILIAVGNAGFLIILILGSIFTMFIEPKSILLAVLAVLTLPFLTSAYISNAYYLWENKPDTSYAFYSLRVLCLFVPFIAVFIATRNILVSRNRTNIM